MPNEEAQNQNTYGSLRPTYRRSQHANMKSQIKSHWQKVVVTVKDRLLISVNFFSKDFFFEGLPRPIRPITKAENAKWRALLQLHVQPAVGRDRALLKLCMAVALL